MAHSLVNCDEFRVAGVALGEPQGQVVGLRAGIDKEADGQVAGHLLGDPGRTVDHLVVKEAVVGGQRRHLLRARLHNLWVAMADYKRGRRV